MKINFILKTEDILYFYKKYVKDNYVIFKNYVFLIALLIAFILRNFIHQNLLTISIDGVSDSLSEYKYWNEVASLFIALIIFILVARFAILLGTRNRGLKDYSITCERELELFNEKIIVLTKNEKSEFLIETIIKIEKDKNHFFLYFNKRNAIIIPRRVIGSDEFVMAIEERQRK